MHYKFLPRITLKPAFSALLVCCTFLYHFAVNAQNTGLGGKCWTGAFEKTAQKPTGFTCDHSSAVYQNYFRAKETYRPVNGWTGQETVTKKIKIRFVVINPDPNAAGQLNFKPVDMPKLNQIVANLNTFASSQVAPLKPPPGCTNCWVHDERIRFELTDVAFVTDANDYGYGNGEGFLTHGQYTDTILNIYLICDLGHTITPGPGDPPIIGGQTVYSAGGWARHLGFYPVAPETHSNNYIVMSNMYLAPRTISSYWLTWESFDGLLLSETKRLFHELHHVMGLHHLYNAVTCNPYDPEYLTDIFENNPVLSCPTLDAPCSPTDPNSNCTNNTMSLATYGTNVSPLQMGQVHRVLYIGDAKSFTYPTEPPTVHPWMVNNDQTWDFPIRVYQDIRVKPGVTLTIKCEVQMPPGGRIVVEKGGKLIVDGGLITSYHGRSTWQGIEVAGNNSLPADPAYQGYLELRNGARLEHARWAICNFTMPGYQCGGIIKASNSHIDNCIMAVALNNTPNHSYMFNGSSNCSFDNVTFIKNDPNYANDQTGYFTAWNIKGGVVLNNCTFHYDIPWDELEYNQRYAAIQVSATGMTIRDCNVDGFQKGIYASGFTGTPSRTVKIYNNHFNHTSESIMMAGDCYGDIKGNTITNMYPYWDVQYSLVRYPVGIYLDYTRGATVGCNNLVDGTTDGGPWPGINRNGFASFNTGGYHTTVMDNRFENLGRGAQPQMDNPQLSILCNRFEGNDYAFAINPETAWAPNTLKDQGTSCTPSIGIRAGNRFINNQIDIASFLANPWTYYAGNGIDEVPSVWWGNMTLSQCFTTANSQCGLPRNCAFQYNWNGTMQSTKLADYRNLAGAGQKNSLEGRVLFADLVRGYGTLDDLNGLQSFLEAENDDNARKLLIPLYIERGLYTQATNTLAALAIAPSEKQAYTDYYNVLMNLHQNNTRPDLMSAAQLATVQSIAAGSFEVSGFAKALLEQWHGQKWDHVIEDIPSEKLQNASPKLATAAMNSELFDAAPNPANSSTLVRVFISQDDAAGRAVLSVRNVAGVEIYQKDLTAGYTDVEIDIKEWTSGLYFYSLISNNKVLQTKKLSVTH